MFLLFARTNHCGKALGIQVSMLWVMPMLSMLHAYADSFLQRETEKVSAVPFISTSQP